MGLITLPPDWAYCTSNYSGTPSGTLGTSLTAGASNADGTAVTVLSALSHDCEYLIVGADGFQASNTESSTLLDILVDPSGGTSWNALINDLFISYAMLEALGTMTGPAYVYHFPLWIKAGTSIGARARNGSAGTLTGRVHLTVLGGNDNPGSWWAGQAVESIGINAATSTGTQHIPGASGTFSSWTNFGSTLAYPCHALQFVFGPETGDTALSNRQYFFEFGVAGNRIGPPLYGLSDASETHMNAPNVGPIFRTLPAGTQLQVRGTSSGTVVDNRAVAAYAVR